MALTGKQKAAMLLMSMDATTASELLKGVGQDTVQELAFELTYLDKSGYRNSKTSVEFAKNFCNSLRARQTFHFETFLNEMLSSTVGSERAQQIRVEINDMLQKQDPFLPVRSMDAATLASVLETEHPQAVGVVLSELDPKKSSQVLGLLGEGVRLSVINRMAGREHISGEAKARIAQMVSKRVKAAVGARAAAGGAPTEPAEGGLRKVAVILRNLGQELRDGLLSAIKAKDSEAGDKVSELMVVWEDIMVVSDRSLQQALRGIDAGKLALALFEAEAEVKEKIRSNISERATAMMEEEASLMSSPKKDDVASAREEIVKVLREMNQKGELSFAEG